MLPLNLRNPSALRPPLVSLPANVVVFLTLVSVDFTDHALFSSLRAGEMIPCAVQVQVPSLHFTGKPYVVSGFFVYALKERSFLTPFLTTRLNPMAIFEYCVNVPL